jgi:MFS family permease
VSSPSAESAIKPWSLYGARRRWIVALVLFLAATSASVDRNIIAVLLEPIKTEFRVSDTQLGMLTGLSFVLFYMTLGIPVARWADRGDRKLIIVLSLCVWSVMTIFCGMAHTFLLLALARVGVGAGESGAIAPSQSLLADYFAPSERGRAFGFFMLSPVIGGTLGLALGGYVAMHWGWRTAFLAVGIPGLLLALAAWLVLEEPRKRVGFEVRPEDHEKTTTAIKTLLAKPAYVNLLIGMVVHSLLAYGALVFATSFLVRIHHLSLAAAGALSGAAGAVGAVVGTVLGAALSDRLCAKDVSWAARLPGLGLIVVMPVYTASFLTPDIISTGGLMVLGWIAFGFVVPPMYSALHLICGSRRRATAVAFTSFCTSLLGVGLGPVVAGLLSDLFAKWVGPDEGLRWAILAMMPLFILSGWFMIRAARHFKADVEA